MTTYRKFATWLAAFAVGFFAVFVTATVMSASYSGYSTGYAYGNLYGSSGALIGQGHFANHSTAWCPGDPAAYWPYNTVISSINPSVVTLDGYGNPTFRTSMVLKDIGDPTCNFGNYWADWYFGRYKKSVDPCSCNNGTEVCYNGWNVSNCDQAVSWGVVLVNYNK